MGLLGPGPRALLGGLLGFLVGLAVWAVAQALIRPRAAEPTDHAAPRGWVALRQAHGAITVGSSLTQASTALWGAYVTVRAVSLAHWAGALWVSAVLVALSIVDFRVRRIPNVLVLALLLWAPVQLLSLGQPGLRAAGLGLLVGGGIFLLLALVQRGAMGAGDVKLVAALGAILGYPLILYGLLIGVVFGGLAAAVLLISGRAGRKDPMAYGPYLALGSWLVWTRVMGLWP